MTRVNLGVVLSLGGLNSGILLYLLKEVYTSKIIIYVIRSSLTWNVLHLLFTIIFLDNLLKYYFLPGSRRSSISSVAPNTREDQISVEDLQYRIQYAFLNPRYIIHPVLEKRWDRFCCVHWLSLKLGSPRLHKYMLWRANYYPFVWLFILN